MLKETILKAYPYPEAEDIEEASRYAACLAEGETWNSDDEKVKRWRSVFTGIKLLNANEQLRREDAGKLLLINEVTNECVKLPLAIV